MRQLGGVCLLLCVALAAKQIPPAKSGTRFGLIQHSDGRDSLIPEVVKRGKLEIGRFEVTRAQYAAFDSSYRYEAGTDNFPANLITPDQAKGYALWLSGITGKIYRLPNEEEVAALYKPASGENTLEAGKKPSLKEVGIFKANGGAGEEPIYDLGGNVTEWVLAKNGEAKTLGGSADKPANAKVSSSDIDPEYTGFRIVREAKNHF